MNKKDKILLITLAAFNFVAGLLLLIFLVPNKIPTILGISEQIVCLGSKWCLVPAIVCPVVFACISIFSKKNIITCIFKSLFFFAIYQNVLIFIVVSASKEFVTGSSFPISLSLLVCLPISCLILVFGSKLKNQPFNTFPVLWKKQATATEFLWTQIHIFAKNVFMSAGLILFIISVVFSFWRLFLIEIGLFVIAIIIAYLIVLKHANDIFKKYTELKNKQVEIKNQKDKN